MDILNCMYMKYGKYLTIILKRLSFFFASEFVGEYLIFESLPTNTTSNLNRNEMGEACGAYWGGERCAQGSGGET